MLKTIGKASVVMKKDETCLVDLRMKNVQIFWNRAGSIVRITISPKSSKIDRKVVKKRINGIRTICSVLGLVIKEILK